MGLPASLNLVRKGSSSLLKGPPVLRLVTPGPAPPVDCSNNIEMARYAAWSAARQWQPEGGQKSLVSACGGLGLRPASQCHFDAISGPEFQFEAHNEMARYAAWSAARQWQGGQKSLVSACGGLGLRPASQCHFDAISGPEFQFEKIADKRMHFTKGCAACRKM